MPEPTAAPPLRHHWPAAALAVAAALVALWARHRLFPALSWNRDEPVYLWHVEALRAGHLTPPDGGHPELFHPWLSARGEGTFFTQYTLGWPLVLLGATVLTGSATAALMVGAAAAVLGTYAIGIELLQDRRIATGGAALLVASPILPVQGGAHLSYLLTLGLGLAYGALFLSGIRRHRPWRLVAGGALVGWIFLTRPYDAILWATAFSVFALVRDRARWRERLGSILACGAAALPCVVVALAYNRHVTGSWLQFPITAADPLDTFGFGPKRLMPTFEVIDYDAGKALRATAKNAFLLPWFLVGTYVGLALAGIGLWQRRRDPSTLALASVAVVFPLGYSVFWGTHLSSLAARISGPIYLIPLYAPICLLMASVLVGWWERRQRLAQAALVVLVVATLPAAITRFGVNHEISRQQEGWRTSVAALDEPALVIVADTAPYLLYLNPFSANPPELDGDVLYAADGSAEVLDLIEEQPRRAVYVQRATVPSQDLGPREEPRDLAVALVPAEVVRGPSLRLAVTARPDRGAQRVRIALEGGTTGRVPLPVGQEGAGLRGSVTLAADASPGAGTYALAGRGTLIVTLSTDDGDLVRHRIHYRVVADGTVEVLTPTFAQRWEQTDEGPAWLHAPDVPELRVGFSSGPD
jgi:hypothetical protein